MELSIQATCMQRQVYMLATCEQTLQRKPMHALKPSSQYDASRRKAPRCDATPCQNLLARRYNFAWHVYCDKSYDVAQNRKKSILSDNRTKSQRVASHRMALHRLASYCELGLTYTTVVTKTADSQEIPNWYMCSIPLG